MVKEGLVALHADQVVVALFLREPGFPALDDGLTDTEEGGELPLGLALEFRGSATDEVVESVISFLGLEHDATAAGKARMERKCLVAFRFNDQGDELAGKVSRFLELLGFSVANGRGFAPRSVS